jgi:hypothetical protein
MGAPIQHEKGEGLMAITYEDICPGYRPHHTGYNGICCCGIYWEGAMPLHTEKGRKLPEKTMDRIITRALRAEKTEKRRIFERNERTMERFALRHGLAISR